MYPRAILVFACLLLASVSAEFMSMKSIQSYAGMLRLDRLMSNETSNELWQGLLRDCSKKVSYSCIQKNAYAYLDNIFDGHDNVTVFDGLRLTKNSLNYDTCGHSDDQDALRDNMVEGSSKTSCEEEGEGEKSYSHRQGRKMEDEPESPLEEVTNALRKKTMRYLATRDYELELPTFFFEGATVKVSPRTVDESGALLRVDFGKNVVQSQGRIFKKIKKFIQNKLLTSFLVLLLIIKLIKVKFMFVLPFLFGIGAAKKLFLKLLLFFVPAFAHIFKLCSSFYSMGGTKYHHHHHKIAHHHHHVPVPVPVPSYYDHHHHHNHDDEVDAYDYAHPHIQYRKDIEELKEWGIEPYEEPYDDVDQHLAVAPPLPGRVPVVVPGVLPAPTPMGANVPGVLPAALQGAAFAGPYGVPQYAPNIRPVASAFPEKRPLPVSAHAHNLAYSGYLDDPKYNRRNVVQQPASASVPASPTNVPPATNHKNPYGVFAQSNVRQVHPQGQRVAQQPVSNSKSPVIQRRTYDDEYYGPIVARLEEIFGQLRFFEESCRERLVCSMYKAPALYTPHSNLVSNELSRDPQELKRGTAESASSQKFHRYLSAARLGQDGGDCTRKYPCHINTE